MSTVKSVAIEIGSNVWFKIPNKEELEHTQDFSENNGRGPFEVIGRADPDHVSIKDRDGTILRATGGFWSIGHFVPDSGNGPPTAPTEK